MKRAVEHATWLGLWLTIALCMGSSPALAAAYKTVAGSTNVVVVPNDGDSPYTLAEIAADIADSAIFSWNSTSNTAVCNAYLSVSGTVHVGKVNVSGGYDAGGTEEKLLIRTNAVKNRISIMNGGALIARGNQGTYGVRRSGTDSLVNEISVTPKIYNYGNSYFQMIANAGSTVVLHDTKVTWCAYIAFQGVYINGGEFDIQRCQLYTVEGRQSVALYINSKLTYANPVLRDTYFGSGANAGPTLYYTIPALTIDGGVAGGADNIQIINCVFDANNDTSTAQRSGNIYNRYVKNLKVVDCLFSRGRAAELVSSATYRAQMEFRNCEFAAGVLRTPALTGTGNAQTWTRFTSYLGCHVVNAKHPGVKVDTGNSDVIVEERSSPAGQAAIYRYTGGNWSVGTNRASTGTDSTGWTPSPTNEGSILLAEMTFTRVSSVTSTNYYHYNLSITNRPAGYYAYDYYNDYGSNYVTSVDNTAGAGDKCMGANWFRAAPQTPNAVSTLNEPPTNGTWYVGLTAPPVGTMVLVR